MTSRECEKARYNINPNYQPIYLTERLSLTETMDDFYARSHEVVKMALRMTEGNIDAQVTILVTRVLRF